MSAEASATKESGLPAKIWLIILAGCIISLVGFGVRSSFGLFLEPMTTAHGLDPRNLRPGARHPESDVGHRRARCRHARRPIWRMENTHRRCPRLCLRNLGDGQRRNRHCLSHFCRIHHRSRRGFYGVLSGPRGHSQIGRPGASVHGARDRRRGGLGRSGGLLSFSASAHFGLWLEFGTACARGFGPRHYSCRPAASEGTTGHRACG